MIAFARHSQARILTILLIAVMTSLLINRAVYTHIHVLPDGSVVAHAHPFPKSSGASPASSHQHSNQIILLLDQLDVLILSVSAVLLLLQVVRYAAHVKPAPNHLLPGFVPFLPKRGPPLYM